MQTKDAFTQVPVPGIVGIILDGGERADEAMYYLLRQCLYLPLKRRYEIFQHHLSDDFDDILEDFFFYLRDGGGQPDGNDPSCGNGQPDETNPSCGGNQHDQLSRGDQPDEDSPPRTRIGNPPDKTDLSCGGNQPDGDNPPRTRRGNPPDKTDPFCGNGGVAMTQGYSEPGSGDRCPYPSLRRIRDREASVQWLLRTFRNYLVTRADREGTIPDTGLDPDCVSDADVPASILTDEEKLASASGLLAYALQEMPPRDGFILLRSLLTLLDKRKSLPNEEMAEALGMTDVAYRVSVHRVKSHLARYRTRLLQGGSLRLDGPHREMARRIHEDFLHLYPTLLYYYTQSINTLAPDRAAAVNRLRQRHLTASDNLLHEPATRYEKRYSKATLWNLVGRFL